MHFPRQMSNVTMALTEAVAEKAEAVAEKVEGALGVGEATRTLQLQSSPLVKLLLSCVNTITDTRWVEKATREQMSEARLPLAYRDSCAHLLIPLNRCRFEEYYLPWKCVVSRRISTCTPSI